MNHRLKTLLTRWGLHDWDDDEETILDLDAIQYLSSRVFDDYEPAQFDRFESRLDRWLHNVPDEGDQRILFRLLNRLFFIGRPEFESLCRAAYHGPVLRWLIDEMRIDIADAGASGQLRAALSGIWFCPITDSMRINAFLKVNGLTGKTHRPDWRSLRKFGSIDKIREYMESGSVDRLVLLEDFVGSGTQMRSAVKFAADNFPELRILACPLVTCPAGDETGNLLTQQYDNVAYEAAMTIAPSMLIKADPQPNEQALYADVRNLVIRVSGRLSVPESDTASKRYHGFKGTGAVVTLYSNCPNNSLPIVWDETPQWKPLFPRLKRA